MECLTAEACVSRGTEALLHRAGAAQAGVLALPRLHLDVRHRHVHGAGLVELSSYEDLVHVSQDGHHLLPVRGCAGLPPGCAGVPVGRPQSGGDEGLLARLELTREVGQAPPVAALHTLSVRGPRNIIKIYTGCLIKLGHV